MGMLLVTKCMYCRKQLKLAIHLIERVVPKGTLFSRAVKFMDFTDFWDFHENYL